MVKRRIPRLTIGDSVIEGDLIAWLVSHLPCYEDSVIKPFHRYKTSDRL